MLGDLDIPKYDNVMVGTELFDDAGVVRISEDVAIVTTVDFFPPVVDDPFDFGAIAAANSLSDLYAMGGQPVSALNIVGFPQKDLPFSVLEDVIRGGLSVAREAGMPIVGGHTLKSPEMFFGLAVTGMVNPRNLLINSTAKSGHYLYLTKPIGTGLITTALKNGNADEESVKVAVYTMRQLNRSASEAVLAVDGCAVTDITGFGLLGHLSQMMAASNKTAVIDYSRIPFLPGIEKLAKLDQFPAGSRSNLTSVEPDTDWKGDFERYEKLILADAQTSGGLLISVEPEMSKKLEQEMRKRKVMIARIGEVSDRSKWLIEVVRS